MDKIKPEINDFSFYCEDINIKTGSLEIVKKSMYEPNILKGYKILIVMLWTNDMSSSESPFVNPEYIFKPCCKMVKPLNAHKDKPEGIRYIPCPSKIPAPRKEKKHEFIYQIEKDKVEFEKARNMSNNNIVKREFNLMGLVGFKKKPYEGLPFTICPGNVFIKF